MAFKKTIEAQIVIASTIYGEEFDLLIEDILEKYNIITQ